MEEKKEKNHSLETWKNYNEKQFKSSKEVWGMAMEDLERKIKIIL